MFVNEVSTLKLFSCIVSKTKAENGYFNCVSILSASNRKPTLSKRKTYSTRQPLHLHLQQLQCKNCSTNQQYRSAENQC